VFIFSLACSPHLSSNNPSGMVYELLWYYFIPKYSTNGFEFIFLNMWTHCSWSSSPICIEFACDITTTDFGETNRWHLIHYNWKGHFVNWSPTHLPFNLKIHLWNIFVFINLVWQHKVDVRQSAWRFALHWICI
jgi:hypothetical protein